MADNVQLQGIEFQIVGESGKASSGVKTLCSNLNKLKNIVSGGLGLKNVVQEIKDFNEALGDNQNWGLLNMASAVGEIAKSGRKLMTVRGHLQGISDIDFSNLTGAAQAIGAIADTAGWQRGTRGADNASAALPTGEPETEHVEGTTQAVKKTSEAMKEGAEDGKKYISVISKVAGILKSGFSSMGKLGFGTLFSPFKRLASQIKETIAPLKKFMSSLGRIALYRAVRGLISGITSALKEGIKNLYAYSKAAGTAFHQSMNTISTDAQWLKNSFAAAVAPIINALAPALDMIASKIASVLNLLAQLFAMLGGHSTYTKAVKSAKEYGAATGGAAKELRMLISGFDELNAFQDKSGGGGGVDASSMFEEADVEDSISEFAKKLKAAFQSEDWEELGALLGGKFNEIVNKIEWKKIGKNIGKKINGVIRTAYSTLKTANFKNLGNKVSSLLNNALAQIDFDKAGRLFTRKITALLDFLVGFINGTDWGEVARAIGNFLKGAFREAAEWLKETDFVELGRNVGNGVIKILDALIEAAREIPWEEFGRAIGEFLMSIDWGGVLLRLGELLFEVASGLIHGLLDTSGGRIALVLFAALKGLPLIFAWAQPKLIEAASSFVASGISTLKGMAPQIAALAPAIGKAALLCADAVLIAYDVKSFTEAADTYKAAFDAHAHETDTALSSYAKLYEEKGKEVADQWAQMVYQIDTSGMNMDEAQKALTEKIEGYWSDVPQDMWQGFRQGVDYYFGENGAGILALFSDGFTGLISGVKDLLGIHSPSTVFESIGSNLVEGLKNGISNAWSGLWSKVTSLVNSLTAGVKNLFGVASPSKVFAEIGGYLDAGLASGMEGGVSGLLSTAGKIANSVTTALTPELPSLASATAGMTPYGIEDRSISGSYADFGEEESGIFDSSNMESVLNVLNLIYETVRTKGTSVMIDGREVFNTVIAENNRAIQRTGASPIRV